MQTITLTRRELYDEVWSAPLLSLSKKYQISDAGLRKMCIRLAIPLPNQGHWNKLRAGKKVIIKPYKANIKVEQQVRLIELDAAQQAARDIKTALPALQHILIHEKALDLTVKEALAHPDPLVIRAQKALAAARKSKYFREGQVLYSAPPELRISVTEPLVNRALCLMDTFLKAMRKLGHDLLLTGSKCCIMLSKEEMDLHLYEQSTRVASATPYPPTDRVPNGRLAFKFRAYSVFTEIKDGKILIEEQLPKLIAQLELFAEEFRQEEAERERRKAAEQEAQRAREAIALRRQQEKQLFKQLLKETARWQKSVELRGYIEQVGQQAINE